MKTAIKGFMALSPLCIAKVLMKILAVLSEDLLKEQARKFRACLKIGRP